MHKNRTISRHFTLVTCSQKLVHQYGVWVNSPMLEISLSCSLSDNMLLHSVSTIVFNLELFHFVHQGPQTAKILYVSGTTENKMMLIIKYIYTQVYLLNTMTEIKRFIGMTSSFPASHLQVSVYWYRFQSDLIQVKIIPVIR